MVVITPHRYDSDAKSSGSEGEERENSEEERAREKSRKRKKEPAKASRPAKRTKDVRMYIQLSLAHSVHVYSPQL